MTKATSQDKISQLEEQIIALQRELDAARKSSTSIWCKLFDDLIDSGFEEEVATEAVGIASSTLLEWVKAQRAKLNRKVSSMGVMPPYSECLNDLVISAANPESDYSNLLTKEEVMVDVDRELAPLEVRLPPPPLPVAQDDPSLHLGPVKMLKVNVPRARPRAEFPNYADSADSTNSAEMAEPSVSPSQEALEGVAPAN